MRKSIIFRWLDALERNAQTKKRRLHDNPSSPREIFKNDPMGNASGRSPLSLPFPKNCQELGRNGKILHPER
jgi:hypothetical protein